MSKPRAFTSPYVLTEARIGTWVRQGRGAGDGENYLPWLTVRNVKSRGRKHRMRGIIHDRVLHLMNDLERRLIRAKLDEALEIADRLALAVVGAWISAAIDALPPSDEVVTEVPAACG